MVKNGKKSSHFQMRIIQELFLLFLVQTGQVVSLTCHFVLKKLYTEPSKGASYQISINLAKWF
jgi:hypothetical protein